MFMDRQNFINKCKNNGDNMMEARDIHKLEEVPAANQAPVSKVVVRRGPQLMVVLSGCPKASLVQALHQANVKVGLALSSSELAKASGLDDYSFVFVGVGHKKNSPLKQAVADLAHNGWSIDDHGRSAPNMAAHRFSNAPVQTTELAIA